MQTAKLSTLYSNRELLAAWTMRTIRARYKQSILGGLWAILQPTATAIIFSIIFTRFVKIDTGDIPYLVFSYTAMAPWTLFTASISDMTDSLVANMNLVSKIYFPREILPISAVLARLLDFAIALVLMAIFIIAYGVPVKPAPLLFFPVILATQLCLTLGLGFIGSALNVFYRDVKHIIALGLQIWLYASPIIYPVEQVPEWLRPYYFLNPMAGIIVSYRDILLQQQMPGYYLGISAVMAVVALVVGYLFFKRVEFQFADVV